MTKQDIIDRLTNECGLQRASAIRAVEGITGIIADALVAGDPVTIRGFATIKPVHVAERIGRNLADGSPITVPAHRGARIVLSRELKSRLNP